MKIRRTLATAVAAAVTTPVLLLSATAAFAADTVPAGQVQDQKPKPTPAELEALAKAVTEAKAAYDAAVTAHAAARKAPEDMLKADSPERKALDKLRAEAKAADTAATEADAALKKAKEDLAKLPEGTPEAEVTKAKEAVQTAQDKYTAAAAARSDAYRTVSFSEGAFGKAHAQLIAAIGPAAEWETKTKKTYDDAVKAYDKAKAEAGTPDPTKPPVDPTKPPVDPTKPPVDPTKPPVDPTKPPVDPTEPPVDDCKIEAKLSTTLVGLPGKVVAGSTVDFTLRVTNGTDKKIDEVKPFAVVYGADKNDFNDISGMLHLQAAAAGSSDWKDVKEAEYAGTVTNLAAGKSADLKLRLTVDKKAPAAEGIAFAAGDYYNENGSCGSNELTEYQFSILAAGSNPGKVPDSKPTPVTDKTNVPVPQGNANTTPVTTDAGNLAATGSSGTTQIALAAGAAIVLGAGAVFVVRRRKASQQA
ncbi:LPXTG cell wall anchor domain-containing protein [Streptomyces sp. NPDC058657]|uniref:LPXTG cell wall anchor domain-containing protein n=1 Tax=unclassified Streptomyces TaxID=2593676 RepID=UPI00365FC61A